MTKASKIPGSDIKEVTKKVRISYRLISRATKRRPYIRSAYFNKNKVFMGAFMSHVFEKNWRDALRRLKYFDCAVDLIRHTRRNPTLKVNPNNPNEILYRFTGMTKNNEIFYVQIKEDLSSGEKNFISVFPEKNQP